ncbi:MAG: DNA-directed RNA polymerase subunit beta', partial [Flavobacteriales bacterium]|nr:DNA-directed RNA polymerase subunit beta' [Flavobacteriales bacterium]
LKGHPILLNRAPTLHRLGIQAFQPKLVEGKAIHLHPLVCTAFNADFDGDQMAVHLPLGHAAILEAQLLMLASHNILNPANGAPITVPSQDMVLGLYYMTKGKVAEGKEAPKGTGLIFYSAEELVIAHNEKKVDLHAWIKIKANVLEGEEIVSKIIETTTGRVLFNQVVPEEVGFINELLTKKSLRDIIGNILKVAGVTKAAAFLDEIKDLGFMSAFKGGLSFNLDDIIIPLEKEELVKEGYDNVDEVMNNYNMGFITNNERYNQIIDIWTHTNSKLTQTLMKQLTEDQGGFNSVFMMLDSGARGSKEQIRQLSGMRGLMAKPQKSGATGGEIIENPILANFKEGLSILEYFISTHGARKGLADTALKTADAGYLTRRLVDVAQDVVIVEPDCGTLMGLVTTDLKNNDELVESLYDRILGRTCVHDVVDPVTGDLIAEAGMTLDEKICEVIRESIIEEVEIRSALSCETRQGICAKCYGRNLTTGRHVQIGEAVGVIAAQSIGEPGTQLTLRTFHVGGTASAIAAESRVEAKHDGILEIDELRVVKTTNASGEKVNVVIGRSAEMRIVHAETKIPLTTTNIPYGAELYKKSGDKVKKGDEICAWDPYNAVIISESAGKIEFEDVVEGITYRVEIDEQTGFKEKVISERKDKTKNPLVKVITGKKDAVKSYNIPVGAHIVVSDKDKIEAGKILVKIPRLAGKTGDITGGLPRVTELFEARNPSNPAVVSEIDGVVEFGKIKRGNQEILITSKTDEVKKYLVSLSKHILVQENDYVRAGMPLSDGAITPADILAIQGPNAVQSYIVNEVQEVYRLQGVKINDKHYEVIVRQMMRKVHIEDAGDTKFLEKQIVDRFDFREENDWIYGKKIIIEPGDSSSLRAGQIINSRKLRDEVSVLKRKDKTLPEYRDAVPAISSPILQGITRASLRVKSFISAASFQETTKVLNEASIRGKQDHLLGLKENVIVGHKIPAGTGKKEYYEMVVGSQEEYDKLIGGASEPKETAEEDDKKDKAEKKEAVEAK